MSDDDAVALGYVGNVRIAVAKASDYLVRSAVALEDAKELRRVENNDRKGKSMKRSDEDMADEIRRLVAEYGLHDGWRIAGRRCCTMEELDAAIAKELATRRDFNSTCMIVTTGSAASPAGVYLPAP